MSEVLSQNTQALLLLTAPLMAGRGAPSPDLLDHDEYNRLALQLHEAGAQPADLLASEAGQVLEGCEHGFDEARLDRLLARGFLLSQAVERWQTRALWVMSRADADYPKRLKTRLKAGAPVLLYGCGDQELLNGGGLAIVGERKADDAQVEFTLSVGRLAAQAGRMVLANDEKGVGEAALRAALDEGGTAMSVSAGGLEKAAMDREHRTPLLEERLVLVSPQDPLAKSGPNNVSPRDRVLYALADAALVVSATANKGATWTGAVEQLEAGRGVPIYARASGATSKSLAALQSSGALPWPDPQDVAGLDAVLTAGASDTPSSPRQGEFSFDDPPDSD